MSTLVSIEPPGTGSDCRDSVPAHRSERCLPRPGRLDRHLPSVGDARRLLDGGSRHDSRRGPAFYDHVMATGEGGTAARMILVGMTAANAMILVDQTAVPLTLPAIMKDF